MKGKKEQKQRKKQLKRQNKILKRQQKVLNEILEEQVKVMKEAREVQEAKTFQAAEMIQAVIKETENEVVNEDESWKVLLLIAGMTFCLVLLSWFQIR